MWFSDHCFYATVRTVEPEKEVFMKVNRWIILAALGIMLGLALACTISLAGDQSAKDTGDAIQLTMSALQQTQTALAPQETQQPVEQPTETNSAEEPDQPTPHHQPDAL